MYKIKWRGDKCSNHESRGGRKPVAIANHITAGTRGSVYNWFISPNNQNASSHFVVTREGEIDQYVRIESAAWTQGLNPARGDIAFATAPVVHEMGVNPNMYCVGIEHEGFVEGHLSDQGIIEIVSHGLDGDLTEKQFWASCWLHKWVQTVVQRIYGVRIPLNGHNVIGHYQIDPRRKPNCPGPKFPWMRLYTEMAAADNMTLEAFEEHINYKQSSSALSSDAFAFLSRINQIKSMLNNPKYGAEAKRKLLLLSPIMPQLGLTGELTPDSILKRLGEIESTAIREGKWQEEGLRKLELGAQHARKEGLL